MLRRLLLEAGDDAMPTQELSNVSNSLDAQINAFLIKADGKSIKTARGREDFAIGEALVAGRMSFLVEADDEGGEFEAAVFAGEIARLLENFENLITVKETVLGMAQRYVGKQHDDATAENVFKSLRDDYSIEVETSGDDPKRSDHLAVGAFPSGGA